MEYSNNQDKSEFERHKSKIQENIDMGKVIDEAYSLIEIPLDIRGIEFESSYEKKSKVKADRLWLVVRLNKNLIISNKLIIFT